MAHHSFQALRDQEKKWLVYLVTFLIFVGSVLFLRMAFVEGEQIDHKFCDRMMKLASNRSDTLRVVLETKNRCSAYYFRTLPK